MAWESDIPISFDGSQRIAVAVMWFTGLSNVVAFPLHLICNFISFLKP